MADIGQLLRVKGVLEASAAEPGKASQAHAESYSRVRTEAAAAVDEPLREEFDRLFPATLASNGQPWGKQGDEAVVLMAQMAGWLGGIIENAVLERRIQAEAVERVKRTGFA